MSRFFIFHFLLPFIIYILIFIHIFYLHQVSSNNPLGYNINNKITFFPFFISKDLFQGHIYTLGLEVDTRAYFTAVTMMISLPTGTKVFNWLSTLLGTLYIIIISSYMIFIMIFLIMFTLGGSTGVILGNAVVDVSLHDTYYIIAHFHLKI